MHTTKARTIAPHEDDNLWPDGPKDDDSSSAEGKSGRDRVRVERGARANTKCYGLR